MTTTLAPLLSSESTTTNGHAPDFVGSRPLRWTDEEYLRLTQQGFFEGRHVELIEGEIIEMAAMEERHWASLYRGPEALRRALGFDYGIMVQSPVRLGMGDNPEPDVAVFAGDALQFRGSVPSTALLVIEISDTTLASDQGRKLRTYARHNVPEYWIVNLQENQVERYLEPVQASSGPTYRSTTIFQPGETLSPHFAPEAIVAVSDLLPLP